MNEEIFNTSTRQFLKKIGITTQREIEKAVWSLLESKSLQGNELLAATVKIEIPQLKLTLTLTDTIHLE